MEELPCASPENIISRNRKLNLLSLRFFLQKLRISFGLHERIFNVSMVKYACRPVWLCFRNLRGDFCFVSDSVSAIFHRTYFYTSACNTPGTSGKKSEFLWTIQLFFNSSDSFWITAHTVFLSPAFFCLVCTAV